jgi:hypothetical protein
MRQPFDQLAKRLLRAVFGLAGAVENQHEIAADALEIDTWFKLDPARAAERERMGLLGRMLDEPSAVFEAYHGAPGLPEYRTAVLKQLTLDHLQALEAAKEPRENDAPLVLPPCPRLWLLCAGRPKGVLEQYDFQPIPSFPEGFFERSAGDVVGLVVLRQLPPGRATLLLRLLAAGEVLAEAIAELKALPDDAWERQVALPLLIALRLEIPQDPTDESDREFLMTTAELYDYWKERYRSEGVKEGHDLGVTDGVRSSLHMAYTTRFGPMPEDVAAIVATIRDAATLSRWLGLILASTPEEEVTRAVRSATSS